MNTPSHNGQKHPQPAPGILLQAATFLTLTSLLIVAVILRLQAL
jgi:hypothetical protein